MIVRSKLLVPRLCAHHVRRESLVRRVRGAADARVVLVVAPAGFGKTTLLAELLADEALPAAFVSLDVEDNDPNRFWAYVGHALEAAIGITSGPDADALLGPAPPPLPAVTGGWANMLLDCDEGGVLVLDDVHVLDEPEVTASLLRFVERIPVTLQVVLSTRMRPDLPLSRWRAAGELLEVGAEDLKLSREQAAVLLRERLGDRVDAAHVDALAERTEGWAAGLQLAIASMRRADVRVEEVVASFDGRRADVADYLAEQIIGALAPQQRAFVEACAILETLTPVACAAVADCTDAGRRLLELEDAGLPITRLDARRGVYRLHHLLRDYLVEAVERGGTASAAELHRRARVHFQAEGDLDRAFVHAAKAGETEVAAALLEQRSHAALARSRPLTLLRDVRRLGRGLGTLGTPLLLGVAWASFLCSRVTELRAALSELHRRRAAGELDDAVWSSVCNVRSGMARQRGELAEAIAFANEGLGCSGAPQSGLLLYRAVAEYLLGDLETAATSAGRCLAEEPAHGEPTFIGITVQSLLGQIRLGQGRLGEAQRLCEGGVQRCIEHGLGEAPMMAVLERTLGRIALERGEWTAARRRFATAFELADAGGIADLRAVIEALTAHWALLTADTATLDDMLARIEPAAGRDAWLGRWRDALVASRELGNGGAVDKVDLEPPADEESWLVEMRRREPGDAIALCEVLRDRARGRVGALVAVLSVAAERCVAIGRVAEADAAVADALRLATPGGIVRGFAEAELDAIEAALARAQAGADLTALERAHAVAVRRALSELAALRRGHAEAGVVAPPLSARELEVLRLLAQGLTNQEAATRLHVSLATIKTHVHRIFHKLGVRRRTQAVARARECGLL